MDSMSTQAGSSEKKKKGSLFGLALLLIPKVFLPLGLAFDLLRDELKLKKYGKYMPEISRPKSDPKRRRVIGAMFLLFGLQVLGLVAFFMGVFSPEPIIETVVRSARRLQMPTIALTSLIPLLPLPIGIAIAMHLKYKMFWSKKSHYKKLCLALSELKSEGFWYYTDRLLYLPLDGVTGEEVVKRAALWNKAAYAPGDQVFRIPETNHYLIPAAPQKPTESTYFYDREKEWQTVIADPLLQYHWFLGEYVKRNAYKFKVCFDNFAMAFIGQSGSGKTEALKATLTSFMCMHPLARLVIADLKGTGDWDVFAPLSETGYVIKSDKEAMFALAYVDSIFEKRRKYMKEKGYNGIKAWIDAEGPSAENAPLILLIDEFPQLAGELRYDAREEKDLTGANTLFKLSTMGRSMGTWFILGTQFGGPDAIPSRLNKNIPVHVCFRVGSPHESTHWIGSDHAFLIGKNVMNSDGTENMQRGYAYIDAVEEYVRFWYLENFYIIHEFYKYGIVPMTGHEHVKVKSPGPAPDVVAKIAKLKSLGKGESSLSERDQNYLANCRKASERFSESFKQLQKDQTRDDNKLPLGKLWAQGESLENYFLRAREGRDVLQAEAASTAVENNVQSKGGLDQQVRQPLGFLAEDDDELNLIIQDRTKKAAIRRSRTSESEKKKKAASSKTASKAKEKNIV